MRASLLLVLFSVSAFAQGLPIKSGSSGNLADVDALGSLRSRVTGLDGGLPVLGDVRGNALQLADDGRIDMSQDQLLFRDVFSGATLNAHGRWFQSLTTQTVTVGAGALTLNASAITTVNTYANLATVQKFRGGIDGALFVRARARPVNLPQTNAEAIVGLGNALTNATPTDGVFFRWTQSGGFECVVNRGGTETSANMTAPLSGVAHVLSAWAKGDQFFCEYDTPSTGAHVEVTTSLDSTAPSAFVESPGVLLRVMNGAVAPALAPQLIIGAVVVGVKVAPLNMGPGEYAHVSGLSALYQPLTGAQMANLTNSAAPASATLSNTAAGYATLGGQWQFAAVAGAETDYALFAVQIPASSKFVVTGVHISTCNTVVAVATTATMFQWGLATGHTAVSLATADATGAAPTSAARRVALAMQSLPVGAAVGQCANDFDFTPSSPVLITDSARFLALTLKMPVGTATATEIFRGTALVNGYFVQ